MDVVLRAMCFRLNDKHKERGMDGKRAKRNIVKELIYKYIRTKIWQLHPGFNIGVTTPITKQADLWEHPCLHWNFVPKKFTKNEELTKQRVKSQINQINNQKNIHFKSFFVTLQLDKDLAHFLL